MVHGFSLRGLLLLQGTGSGCAASVLALQHVGSSLPGTESLSPVLAGGLLTTGPPGEPPAPVFLPGEFPGPRGLEGYSQRGCKESDMRGTCYRRGSLIW